MKLDKRYIKFFEVENNRYYLLPVAGELHIVTETILPIEKKFLWFRKKKDLVQGLKLLELTAPISMLFQEIINTDVDKNDEEFPDMTTYKKVDNLKLRTYIENSYKNVMDQQVEDMRIDFENWLDNTISSTPNISEREIVEIEKTNRERLERNIMAIKEGGPLNYINFKWKSGENLIIKRMLDNNMEFLYSQKIGSSYKIYYLYELDVFGVVTIYKIHCVKDIVKSIETFIYSREIIQELIACMVNNNL